ncbi:MAG: sensor histidine kinase [Firmicutes bacterium]|nr:sensor histidine kinase [Bacillota bacterium]
MVAETNKTESRKISLPTNVPKPLSTTKNHNKETIDALLVLSHVVSAVSGLNELNAILKVGVEKTLEFLEGSFGGVMLLDKQDNRLHYRVYKGLSDEFTRRMIPKIGEGINGKVALTGKAVLLDDISKNPEVLSQSLLHMEGWKAFISVPLRFKDKIFGVLNCASPHAHQFTIKDMHLLHSIGDQLGIAIGQARLYERLQEKRERYRQVARQVLTAQEEEKRRISQELHDETSQMLAALTLNLQVLTEMAGIIGIEDGDFKAMLAKIHASSIQINDEVNRLIADLRPTLLDSLGFVPAIRHYAESCLAPLDINITFEMEESSLPLSPEVEVNLFRWVQGVVGNIMQHSEAKNVIVHLQKKNNELEICIKDDGRGFDVSKIGKMNSKKRRHGIGLMILKERMRLIDGDCLISSEPGEGTSASAKIPLT